MGERAHPGRGVIIKIYKMQRVFWTSGDQSSGDSNMIQTCEMDMHDIACSELSRHTPDHRTACCHFIMEIQDDFRAKNTTCTDARGSAMSARTNCVCQVMFPACKKPKSVVISIYTTKGASVDAIFPRFKDNYAMVLSKHVSYYTTRHDGVTHLKLCFKDARLSLVSKEYATRLVDMHHKVYVEQSLFYETTAVETRVLHMTFDKTLFPDKIHNFILPSMYGRVHQNVRRACWRSTTKWSPPTGVLSSDSIHHSHRKVSEAHSDDALVAGHSQVMSPHATPPSPCPSYAMDNALDISMYNECFMTVLEGGEDS